MNLVVTGGAGFIGLAFVRRALAEGHRVDVILRPGRRMLLEHPNLTARAIGLTGDPELVEVLGRADVVVHLAAALRGSRARHRADTIAATAHLLGALRTAGPRPLVALGSFAVYDCGKLPDGGLLDEECPVWRGGEGPSPYAQAKREQEVLLEACGATVLRPGIVYADDRLWTPALGRALGPRAWLRVGPDAPVPVVHVEDVVSALLLAVQRGSGTATALNLVEDRPPSRWLLLEALNSATTPPRWILNLPWSLHRRAACFTGAAMRFLQLPAHWLPGLLDERRVECSFKPLRYDNSRARSELGWSPTHNILAVLRALPGKKPRQAVITAQEAAREPVSPS